MQQRKLLVIGASENLVDEHNQDYHYITNIAAHYDLAITNLSIGGMSNAEIFHRSMAAIAHECYDLGIVMWTSVVRKWLYFADRNVDDYTVLNMNSAKGHRHNDWAVKEYQKLYYSFFCNHYVLLRELICQMIALECSFKQRSIPAVMFHDFDNNLSDIQNFCYQPDRGFENISLDFKKILDFDNRPDHYINEKLQQLRDLISGIDLDCWVDFADFRFSTSRVDRDVDGHHAGPRSHMALFERLKHHIDSRKIFC